MRAFLVHPLDKRCFDPFFKLCVAETMPYLRRLRAAGWQLPIDQTRQQDQLTDLASYLIGLLLASQKDRPYYVVFDNFRRHGITDFTAVAEEEMARLFRILAQGFTRKGIHKLSGEENPSVKNLKRRVKDTLNGAEFGSKSRPGGREEYFFLSKNVDALRADRPPISKDLLATLVLEAFFSTTTVTDWCRQIFALLDEESEFRNALSYYELVRAMIVVNAEYIDTTGLATGHLPTPTEEHLRRTIAGAIDQTIGWVESTVISRFVDKGRLAAEDVPLVLKACREYLEDLGQGGPTGSIPSYFLALRPELTQKVYLKEYKHVLDTVTGRALQEFRRRLKDDPTIRPFGGYI